MKPYVYETCCVDLSPEEVPALKEMVHAAKKVTYRTVLRHCEGLLGWATRAGYTVLGPDLHLKNDWAVGYYRSSFKGRPCYFVKWSAIEYIWVKRPN